VALAGPVPRQAPRRRQYQPLSDSSGNVWGTTARGLIQLMGGSTPPASCPPPPSPGDTGCPISPSGGFTGPLPPASFFNGLAIDGSGDVWVVTSGTGPPICGSVTEFVGAAAPVLTPTVACL